MSEMIDLTKNIIGVIANLCNMHFLTNILGHVLTDLLDTSCQ